MSYVTNDVNALQSAMVENVVEMFTESVILIVSIAMMLYLDWKLFLVTFATFPVVLFFIDSFGKRIRKSGSRIQELLLILPLYCRRLLPLRALSNPLCAKAMR